MKQMVSAILCAIFALSVFMVPASAREAEGEPKAVRTVEYLEDGSYFVTEVTQAHPLARGSKSGSKTVTHYFAGGVAAWQLTVTGTFSYTPGASAKASSASAAVTLFASGTSFVSKNAYTSGASAHGYGQVRYSGRIYDKSVTLTCDSYGNLS